MNRYYNKDWDNYSNIIEEELTDKISGSGGGSCFPGEMFVRTKNGYTPIKTLEVGDLIFGYDKFGYNDFGVIRKIHKHTGKEISHNLLSFNNGLIICTANHAIFDYETNEHKLASDFKIGDSFTTFENKQIEITSIETTLKRKLPEDFSVYNLEVEPLHTYYVTSQCLVNDGQQNWIKVHNGGGGKSNEARPAVEDPNTLRSEAVVKVLEVISEGEIVGVVGGKSGVYFNGTRLQSPEGTNNFKKVEYEERTGTPSQTVISGFAQIESENVKGTTVTSAAPVSQTIIGSGITSARVTLGLPDGLWYQDPATGDLHGNSVKFAIDTKIEPGGAWVEQFQVNKTGKTTASYEMKYLVNAPSAQWSIRVRKLTGEPPKSNEKKTLTFSRWTEIIDKTEVYNNTAYVGLKVRASSVGNQIPTRGYDVMGRIIQVPSNYDPATHTYSGTWNGSFKNAWSDNTAWILYDILTHQRYGLATYFNQNVTIDKWEFYNCAVYNDQLVPNGLGGYENRYTFNGVIQLQSEAWQLIQAIASNMRAIVIMKGADISLVQDRPTFATKIINNANVLNGDFVYSSADATNRITAVNVTFNDKADWYLPKTISLENNTSGSVGTVNYGNGVNLWGFNKTDIAAYGCVTESYALRMARWMLYTEARQYNTISFGLGLNVMDCEVGDVVKVMDNDFISDTTKYLSGRISSASGTSVILAVPVTLDSGYTYRIGITNLENTDIIERQIQTGAGTYSTITIDTALPAGDYSNKEFFCYATGHIEPKQYKITSIIENEKGQYAITGMEYDPQKWGVVENGLSIIVTSDINIFASETIEAPSALVFNTITYNDPVYGKTADIQLKWTCASDVVNSWTIRWQREGNAWSEPTTVNVKEFFIKNVSTGHYYVEITSVRADGKISGTTTGDYIVETGTTALLPPTNLVIAGTTGTTFYSRDLSFTWVENIANADLLDEKTANYWVEIRTSDNTLIKGTLVPVSTPNYTYYYDDMVIDGKVNRTFIVNVYAVDALSRKSTTFTGATFSNPAPGVQSFTVTSSTDAVYINVTTAAETDHKGYIIHRSTTTGFTPAAGNIVYDGVDSAPIITATPGTTYFYKVAAYDVFGKTGLNYSGEVTSRTLSNNAYNYSYVGLVFTPVPATNTLNWTAGYANVVVNDTSTTYAINAGTLTSTAANYIYYQVGANALAVTTNFDIANIAGRNIIAVYRGGSDLQVGNGKPIIDGSTIIAATVGAAQLRTNEAIITGTAQIANSIITNAHIQNGVIDNAKIGNVIQSTNYVAGSAGWKLDKSAGLEINGGNFTLRNNTGDVILSTTGDVQGAGSGGGNLLMNANFSSTVSASSADQIISPPKNWTTHAATGAGYAQVWHNSVYGAYDYTAVLIDATADLGASYFYQDVQIEQGKWYEASVYTGAHRCQAFLQVQWLDVDRTHHVGTAITSPANNNLKYFNEVFDNSFRCFLAGESPAGAYWARIVCYKTPTIAGQGDSYGLYSRAMFGRCRKNQVTPSEWQTTGGMNGVGSINPANISTYIEGASIGSAQIGNLSVGRIKIADRSVTDIVSQTRTGGVICPKGSTDYSNFGISMDTYWQCPATDIPYKVIFTAFGNGVLTRFNNSAANVGWSHIYGLIKHTLFQSSDGGSTWSTYDVSKQESDMFDLTPAVGTQDEKAGPIAGPHLAISWAVVPTAGVLYLLRTEYSKRRGKGAASYHFLNQSTPAVGHTQLENDVNTHTIIPYWK